MEKRYIKNSLFIINYILWPKFRIRMIKPSLKLTSLSFHYSSHLLYLFLWAFHIYLIAFVFLCSRCWVDFMALLLDRTLLSNNMDTSNFAHVIFQNVGKSYLPHAALECHYTLTQFIKPHPKDWVGIFKVNEWNNKARYIIMISEDYESMMVLTEVVQCVFS